MTARETDIVYLGIVIVILCYTSNHGYSYSYSYGYSCYAQADHHMDA